MVELPCANVVGGIEEDTGLLISKGTSIMSRERFCLLNTTPTGRPELPWFLILMEKKNSLPLRNIPLGTSIFNVELRKGSGAKLARSAGTSVELMAKEGKFAHLKLPSGEVRLVDLDCCATIGCASNVDHNKISLGKAGRSRWLGIRSTVRGVAKNPIDHPLGGGEGKSSGGRHPVTPWGKSTKGLKTRKKKKYSDKYIIKRRVSKKMAKAEKR